MCTDCTSPTARHEATIAEPPWETNGSGMPVIGMMPRFIPTFSKMWKSNIDITPIHNSVPVWSAASCATLQIRHVMMANSTNSNPAPTNPNSSPATVKMKSVCCAGT